MDERKGTPDVEEVEERRCGGIDSLASQRFNTTELLLHSSPYEMRSLSLSDVLCVGLCVRAHVCSGTCVIHLRADQ